ncbi:MAG TPA: alpha/beta hydrolase, partial [Acidimicrobiales bacterium]
MLRRRPTPPLPARSLRLRDGRRIGWVEVGDPYGRPVLHFHGTPGCAAEATPLMAVAVEAGVRLIAVDRPGLGHSDPHPGRTLRGWADDMVELADRLELDRPGVVGFSGGGPYALALGAVAPERFGPIAVVSGAGPLDSPEARKAMDHTDRTLTWLSFRAPAVGAAVVAVCGYFTRLFPAIGLRIWESDLPAPDRAVLRAGGQQARASMRYLAQAAVEGARGVVDDERVLALPWGFGPADVVTRIL